MGCFRPAAQHGQLGPEANTAHGRPNMNSTDFRLLKKIKQIRIESIKIR
jgi:hypothetical protein